MHSSGKNTKFKNLLFYDMLLRVLLAPPIRKQVVTKMQPILYLRSFLILLQIIKEQLAFPSGTATAQLISVLHRRPLPGTALRNRRGYSPLNSEGNDREDYQAIPSADDEGSRFEHAESPSDEAGVADAHKREEIQQEGWSVLGWSFAASAALTASRSPITGHRLRV